MMRKFFTVFRTAYLEGIIWISALLCLALIDPHTGHFTMCPFSNIGIDFCPGCGLGKSINLLFSLSFKESFNTHPLGLFALMILLTRIYRIFSGLISNKNFINERKEK